MTRLTLTCSMNLRIWGQLTRSRGTNWVSRTNSLKTRYYRENKLWCSLIWTHQMERKTIAWKRSLFQMKNRKHWLSRSPPTPGTRGRELSCSTWICTAPTRRSEKTLHLPAPSGQCTWTPSTHLQANLERKTREPTTFSTLRTIPLMASNTTILLLTTSLVKSSPSRRKIDPSRENGLALMACREHKLTFSMCQRNNTNHLPRNLASMPSKTASRNTCIPF